MSHYHPATVDDLPGGPVHDRGEWVFKGANSPEEGDAALRHVWTLVADCLAGDGSNADDKTDSPAWDIVIALEGLELPRQEASTMMHDREGCDFPGGISGYMLIGAALDLTLIGSRRPAVGRCRCQQILHHGSKVFHPHDAEMANSGGAVLAVRLESGGVRKWMVSPMNIRAFKGDAWMSAGSMPPG